MILLTNQIIPRVKSLFSPAYFFVVLINCTQIKECNEIIIRHNIFTKLLKKKTKLKLHWKLFARKVGKKKLKLY